MSKNKINKLFGNNLNIVLPDNFIVRITTIRFMQEILRLLFKIKMFKLKCRIILIRYNQYGLDVLYELKETQIYYDIKYKNISRRFQFPYNILFPLNLDTYKILNI